LITYSQQLLVIISGIGYADPRGSGNECAARFGFFAPTDTARQVRVAGLNIMLQRKSLGPCAAVLDGIPYL
jgi:hypothetical protein